MVVVDQKSDELINQDAPDGLIVVKVLRPRPSIATDQSDEPKLITDSRETDYVRCRSEPVVALC